jgi:regulatory protein
MPTITDIKKQKKSDTRFSVFVDGRYALSLSDLDVSTSGLRIGQELTAEELDQLAQTASETKAYAMALRYLSIRPRSVREMSDYLRRKDIAPDDIEAVLGRLIRSELLDDAAFAETWIRHRQSLRPRSRRVLEQELLAKGVARDDIGVAMQQLDETDEVATLAELMERKQRQTQYGERDKLMAYFARQGYPYDLVKQALERLSR